MRASKADARLRGSPAYPFGIKIDRRDVYKASSAGAKRQWLFERLSTSAIVSSNPIAPSLLDSVGQLLSFSHFLSLKAINRVNKRDAEKSTKASEVGDGSPFRSFGDYYTKIGDKKNAAKYGKSLEKFKIIEKSF